MKTENTKRNADQAISETNAQLNDAIVEPVREYGVLTTNYFEKLFSVQFDAVRNFSDNSIAQSRSWLEVKDSDSFKQVIEQQQQAVREFAERLKEDADKIRALSEEYMRDTQSLTKDSMQTGRKHLEKNMQKGKDQVENTLKKVEEVASDIHQKSEQQADKSRKSTTS
ncbi:MAG: phasin family protein [Halomonas sp.]|nr:phasin family protein [Halomonas sp.]MCC5882091.1 phasin family protein [Halomonas sp.]